MATVHLPGSLLSLFPGAARKHVVEGGDVAEVIAALDTLSRVFATDWWKRAASAAPHQRVRRGQPADLTTPVGRMHVLHVIPAVSGG